MQNETLDGDDLVDNDENSSGNGFKFDGVRYMRPNYIGRSFTTTRDMENEQDCLGSRQTIIAQQPHVTNLDMTQSNETTKALQNLSSEK